MWLKYISQEYRSVTDLTNIPLAKTDYYDITTLKYLFSFESLLKGPRLINTINVILLEEKYNIKLNTTLVHSPASAYLLNELESKSVLITIENAGVKFRQLWDSSIHDDVEKTGYVVFDGNNRHLYFQQIAVKGATAFEAPDPYQAGQSLSYNTTVIANVHTHPKEHESLGKRLKANPSKRVDDAYNFEFQYTRKVGTQELGDGLSAGSRNTSRYTISKFNIDFFSPKGRGASVNNIAPALSLFSNEFNLLKHALEIYSGKRR